MKDKKLAPDHRVELQHGKPIIFGSTSEKAIKLNRDTLALEVIQIAGKENQILVHDENNRVLANMLALMRGPDFPVAIGVIYREDKSSFIEDTHQQLLKTRVARGNLQQLLGSGHTWVVE